MSQMPAPGEPAPEFRAKLALPFTLLFDDGAAVASSYGAGVERTKEGRTRMRIQRSTFLVGPDGRIAHAWPAVTPEGHAGDVRAVLAAAKARASS